MTWCDVCFLECEVWANLDTHLLLYFFFFFSLKLLDFQMFKNKKKQRTQMVGFISCLAIVFITWPPLTCFMLSRSNSLPLQVYSRIRYRSDQTNLIRICSKDDESFVWSCSLTPEWVLHRKTSTIMCVFLSTGTMHVSLAEALQVRGGPLQEEEVWAVLNQSAESLQELMRTG